MARIYKVTNLVNNKIYIGQTTQTLAKRWGDHCSIGSCCKALSRAIQKYGKENFKVEEVCSVLNKSDLNDLEHYFIKYYNSFGKNGYNLSWGYEGDGSHVLRKAIVGYNPKTNESIYFDKVNQVGKLGFDSRTIHRCLSGQFTRHKGYFWFYANDFNEKSVDKAINEYLNVKMFQSRKNSTSKYRGVSFVKHINKWNASIKIQGKSFNLGYYNTEIEAKNVYLQRFREVTIG